MATGTVDMGSMADWFSGVVSSIAIIVALSGYRLQERQRKFDRELLEKQRKAIVRDACSATDQVVAYFEMSKRILNSMGSPLSFQAFVRIREHLLTLHELLEILSQRVELTDGAMNAAVTARRICGVLLTQLDQLDRKEHREWMDALMTIERLNTAAQLASERSSSVRRYFGLSASTAAQDIEKKYSTLANELDYPADAGAGPRFPDLSTTRY
ncbi:hypothetical protein [Rhizobium fabae]|uniref:Uncharacterized protein n=2 Tax=Rhizobium fabae TaxID=573179 RepID=A0A7W6FLK5_9HYPH|nr:hypothetical protein [Rhizobium fabae]MBB3918335.1 hypothetical protein [Rhizobium fabae]